MADFAAIRASAARQIGDAVAFAGRLVQTPSMPGQEGAMAQLVREEMTRLAYDHVEVDEMGNVIGLLRGQGSGRSVLFNTHMDHVSPGERAYWHADPFSGAVADGALWGRGSTDIKGPMACQIHTVPLLREAGMLPRGDVWVVAAVLEEVGGFGTRQLARRLRTDSAVIGEPSQCQLKRGHRGRTGLEAQIVGRAGHASAPDRAVNPHFSAAAFLLALRDLPMATHPDFGAATLVPTLYRSDNESVNVIPESVLLHLDWRTVPGEDAERMVTRLQAVLDDALAAGSRGQVRVVEDRITTYTGIELRLPAIFPAYALEPDHWAVRAGEQTLSAVFDREMRAGIWRFATDGGHLHAAGVPPIGFGPGDEAQCHVADEHISITQMEAALVGNAALALALTDSEGVPGAD